MPKWIITTHTFDPPPAMRTVSTIEGSEDEAILELLNVAKTHNIKIKKVIRREIYRFSERQYLVRLHGNWDQAEYIVQLGELITETQ